MWGASRTAGVPSLVFICANDVLEKGEFRSKTHLFLGRRQVLVARVLVSLGRLSRLSSQLARRATAVDLRGGALLATGGRAAGGAGLLTVAVVRGARIAVLALDETLVEEVDGARAARGVLHDTAVVGAGELTLGAILAAGRLAHEELHPRAVAGDLLEGSVERGRRSLSR